MAVRSGIAFDVVTCVNRRNYSQLPQLKEFLIGLRLKEWRLFSIFPQGRAALNPDLQLPREMFRGMLDFIKETRKEGRIKAGYGCEGFLGPYEGDVRDHFYSCQAGVTVGSVLVDGSISACTSIRSDYHQGNIYEDDFMDVWSIASNLTVTGIGCGKTTAPTASTGNGARATECTSVTRTAS